MTEFIYFFVILTAGLLFSEVFKRLHLPWVAALIIAGIIIGPSVLGIIEPNQTISVIGQIGLVFLMFMAGLETKFSAFRNMRREVSVISLFSGAIPFLVGMGIGLLFGLPIITSLLIGIVFVSSSVAVVIPVFEGAQLLRAKLGKTIMASVLIQDVVSLVLVSIFFQATDPVTVLPLWLFYILLILFLVTFRFVVPYIEKYLKKHWIGKRDIFQRELQIVFVILLGTVLSFELLGLHPIVAGFFAGLVLSDSITNETLKSKLRVLAYGLFIPIFFILVGLETNLYALGGAGLFAVVLIIGSMASKYFSGWLSARAVGFKKLSAQIIGVSGIPSLSTTLAVVFLAFEVGIFDDTLVAAMVGLSVVSTFVAPILMRWLVGKLRESPVGTEAMLKKK